MPASQPESIRVAIVEDQPEIREGLSELIDGTAGFQITGVFSAMEDGLAGIGQCVPDVALVDIGLPGLSGIEGIRILHTRYPTLATVVLTIYDDDERIFQAICAGACGYLLKKIHPERLIDSIREAVTGGAAMSPEVARRVMAVFRTIRAPQHADYQLTPHETRLLKLLVGGHNYKTAAGELGVSIHTISFHLRAIYGKLHVHSKTEAVAKALRDGLIR
jgi:DNA-binding NarL/FixJ family response regulator